MLVGRIYYLSFQSYDDKYFFWIQEPDQSKDQDLMTQVQKVIDFNEEEEAKLKGRNSLMSSSSSHG